MESVESVESFVIETRQKLHGRARERCVVQTGLEQTCVAACLHLRVGVWVWAVSRTVELLAVSRPPSPIPALIAADWLRLLQCWCCGGYLLG